MLQNLLPNDVEVKILIHDVRLRSNLSSNRTIQFTKKSFFFTVLGFNQSHSAERSNIEGIFQIIQIYRDHI